MVTGPLFVAGAAEQELFRQQAHLLVTPAPGSDVEGKLLDAASSGWLDLQLNLQRITPSTLASTLLPTVLDFGDRCEPASALQGPCLLGVSASPIALAAVCLMACRVCQLEDPAAPNNTLLLTSPFCW